MANRTLMRTYFGYALFLSILGVSLSGHTSVQEFTLEEAKLQALKANPEIQVQGQEATAKTFERRKLQSRYLPKLGLESSYQSLRDPNTSQSGTMTHGFLEYSLFNGGRDYYLVEGLQLKEEAAQIRIEQKKQEIEWDVEQIFSRYLYLNDAVLSYQAAIQRNKEHQKAALTRKRAGLVSDADILEFELYSAILESELASLKAELTDTQADFNRLLGIDPIQPTQPKGRLVHFHVKSSLAEVRAAAQTNNKEILALQKFALASQASVHSVRGEFLPSLTLKATHGSRDLREANNPNETALWLTARWELFSGLENYWGYQQSVAERQATDYNLANQQLKNSAQLEKHFAGLIALEKRVDLELLNRERAQKYFSVVTSEYKRGVKNSPDLRSASEKLLESEIRDLKYRYEFIAKKVELQKIMGTPIRVVPGATEGHKD